jgi:DNA-binding transcriptional LysR family regulator
MLDKLATFLAVADRQSFSAAAAALGISRSAVSQTVRALERELQTPLFVRTTRSVRLTDAGVRLATTAGPAVRQAEEAVATVRAGEAVGGTLRLTVPHIAVPAVVGPALPVLRSRHRELAIEVVVDDRLTDVIAEGFDAGIRIGEHVEKDMIGVRVSEPFRFVVVAAPTYLARRGRPAHPRELVEHDCIGYRFPTTGVQFRWQFERRGRDLSIQVPSSVITTDTALMVRAAIDGLGLAYVDQHTAAPYLASKQLALVLEPFLPRVSGFFLYYPEHARASPKIRALVDVLRVR